MFAKRIIPCLDVDEGRVVKGVNFVDIIDAGDPVEAAKRYNDEGADELVFLDITASSQKRKTMINVVEKIADQVFIPLTVGGGIRTIDDIRNLLNAGADKVAVNTEAVLNPDFIKEASYKFGSQNIVATIDAKRIDGHFEVVIYGGRKPTGIDAVVWAGKMADFGAGEIMLTSMDTDGTVDGYDIELTKAVNDAVGIPVIASGGAGKLSHFYDVLKFADAALAASVFHYKKFTIIDVKEYLRGSGIAVRL